MTLHSKRDRRGPEESARALSRSDAKSFMDKAIELAGPVLERLGLELVLMQCPFEGGRQVLRVFIDRRPENDDAPGSAVSLDDCANFSRALETALDDYEAAAAVEWPPYVMEVSSPGLDRPLIKEADFIRFQGREVKIKIRRDGRNQSLVGPLGRGEEGAFSVESGGEKVEFVLEDVLSARLRPRF